MSFDLPILARAAAAVPDILGTAGVLYHTHDYPVLAETLQLMVEDRNFCERLIEGQRARLSEFAPGQIIKGLQAALTRVGIELPMQPA